MGIRLLHIGLGKAGSSFLQREIFPAIENETKIKIIKLYDIIDRKKVLFHPLENITKLEKYLPDNFILSSEDLFSKGWEFSNILKSFEYIKKQFSSDTIILLVLRNPYELLNSIYIQSIQEIKIINSMNFFYKENNNIIRKNNMYNLYNFDYIYLVNLYKSYFKKVVVVKYENITEFSYLKEIFYLEDNFLKYLKEKNNKIYNRSISYIGIKIIIFLNKLINLKKIDFFLRNNIKPSENILFKIKNRILSQFLLREFFQKKFDKIVPYKKYYINKDYIPIDIDKIVRDYINLKF